MKDADLFDSEALTGGVNYYKRYMAAHYWRIYRNNFEVNDKKAGWLQAAQIVFLLVIVGLIVTTSVIGFIAATK